MQREGVQAKVWDTKRTDLHPMEMDGSVVGDNHPGRLIRVVIRLSVQNNPKKQNRLELFGIFSDDQNNNQSGKIWNIFEDKNGEWNSKWKIINEQLKVTNRK